MTRQHLVTVALVLAILALTIGPAVTYANCSTPVGAPHQGAAIDPAPGSFIYTASANISYNNPNLGCTNQGDSFTDEWVMVVGPGPEEWLQFGWERKTAYPNVHLWYQYHHQGSAPVDVDILYEPAVTHEYKIMSAIDGQTGNVTWWLVFDGTILYQFTATQMGWTQPTNGASEAQWSAELAYDESEMGGLLPNLVTFDNLYYQEGDPSQPLQAMTPSWIIRSSVPKYGGDPVDVATFNGSLRNWTWPYLTYLPVLENYVEPD